MDGVNGVTQCSIAPGDSFTYNWSAVQYGSSWYHGRYSVQYADGAVGPMVSYSMSNETCISLFGAVYQLLFQHAVRKSILDQVMADSSRTNISAIR